MSIRKRRALYIAALLILTAAAVVLCVNLFAGSRINEYDGTLVSGQAVCRGVLENSCSCMHIAVEADGVSVKI